MMLRTACLGLTALLVSACQTTAPASETATVAAKLDHPSLSFAQSSCGGCHAVEAPGVSPNPASPSFADIANRRGLTRATLTAYLTDAHNYPAVMDFDLDQERIDGLVDYILTLRSADYRNPS